MTEVEAGGEGHNFLKYDGPKPGCRYPLRVIYCGECSMPTEYCEYYPNYEKCKQWLEKNLPEEFERLMEGKEEVECKGDDGEEKKKRQTRGGKGMMKAKKKAEPQGIRMWTATRGKKKKVTVITGLASYDIDLKEASKFFATKFSCGSSVTAAEDEIVVQGDVKDDLWDILPEKWSQIDEDSIDDRGDKK
ncbi:density-regulated protein homolog [Gigantopelta aegis]|uniref:density-regulated protein homolog n=1 Tax=Gigantopelta aegis TaxID=1735272 RepID=UPI001B887590|nr:density-regulated protein homolog [Gigantopelta aegis]XP_041350170.1 density-regulated protein homolog [Gigantopelta aegis]